MECIRLAMRGMTVTFSLFLFNRQRWIQPNLRGTLALIVDAHARIIQLPGEGWCVWLRGAGIRAARSPRRRFDVSGGRTFSGVGLRAAAHVAARSATVVSAAPVEALGLGDLQAGPLVTARAGNHRSTPREQAHQTKRHDNHNAASVHVHIPSRSKPYAAGTGLDDNWTNQISKLVERTQREHAENRRGCSPCDSSSGHMGPSQMGCAAGCLTDRPQSPRYQQVDVKSDG